MDQPQPGKPTDYSTHTSKEIGTDPWANLPASERPYSGPKQESNVPKPDPHTNDPWNKPFKD